MSDDNLWGDNDVLRAAPPPPQPRPRRPAPCGMGPRRVFLLAGSANGGLWHRLLRGGAAPPAEHAVFGAVLGPAWAFRGPTVAAGGSESVSTLRSWALQRCRTESVRGWVEYPVDESVELQEPFPIDADTRDLQEHRLGRRVAQYRIGQSVAPPIGSGSLGCMLDEWKRRKALSPVLVFCCSACGAKDIERLVLYACCADHLPNQPQEVVGFSGTQCQEN